MKDLKENRRNSVNGKRLFEIMAYIWEKPSAFSFFCSNVQLLNFKVTDSTMEFCFDGKMMSGCESGYVGNKLNSGFKLL